MITRSEALEQAVKAAKSAGMSPPEYRDGWAATAGAWARIAALLPEERRPAPETPLLVTLFGWRIGGAIPPTKAQYMAARGWLESRRNVAGGTVELEAVQALVEAYEERHRDRTDDQAA